MRSDQREQGLMLATVVLEERIPATHPLRDLRRLVDPMLRDLSPTFDALYSGTGRSSIPPEQLLRALLLQVLYCIRSERQLVEQLEYNLLYRWSIGLDLEASAWHDTTFTKNWQRLLDGAMAGQFLARVLGLAGASQLISLKHFSVDGTLLEAWVNQKSVRPLDDDDRDRSVDPDNTGVSFHGERRTNDAGRQSSPSAIRAMHSASSHRAYSATSSPASARRSSSSYSAISAARRTCHGTLSSGRSVGKSPGRPSPSMGRVSNPTAAAPGSTGARCTWSTITFSA